MLCLHKGEKHKQSKQNMEWKNMLKMQTQKRIHHNRRSKTLSPLKATLWRKVCGCDGALLPPVHPPPPTDTHTLPHQGMLSRKAGITPITLVTEGMFARRAQHPNECSGHLSMLYPQTPLPPLAQEPKAQAHCMTVGNQITSHFSAQQIGRSHAPYPCRPHHGHPPQNQRIPLFCMTDHSSGHTEEWESELEGPHQSVGKPCPARARFANVLSQCCRARRHQSRSIAPTIHGAESKEDRNGRIGGTVCYFYAILSKKTSQLTPFHMCPQTSFQGTTSVVVHRLPWGKQSCKSLAASETKKQRSQRAE